MPRVVVTAAAAAGLVRCQRFLAAKSARAAGKAAAAIKQGFAAIGTHPDIGRPFGDDGMMRELLIDFGDSGYVALYHHDPAQDTVLVLAFRHQREAGY